MTRKKARQTLDRSRKVVNTKIYIYNELFTWDRKVLDKPKEFVKIPRIVVLQGKDESKTKYSASQVTLITWTNHPKNKQGIQAKKTSTKNLHSKRSIMSYYKAWA